MKQRKLTDEQRRLFKKDELATYRIWFLEELNIFKLIDANGYVCYKNSNAAKFTGWLPKGTTERAVCGYILEVTSPDNKKGFYNSRNLELIEGGLRNVTSVRAVDENTLEVIQQFAISR